MRGMTLAAALLHVGVAAHSAALCNRSERPKCGYAITASRPWFSGFITLLSSVEHANGPHDHCSYVILTSPLARDTQLTAGEQQLVKHFARKKRVIFREVDAERLRHWGTVPHLRSGVLLAWMKLDLFFDWHDCNQPENLIFLDTDMFVLRSLTFVHRHLESVGRVIADPSSKPKMSAAAPKWTLHGSTNWFGVSGWLFRMDTTPPHPFFVNTGFLAFKTPAPTEFLEAMESRVAERIRDDLKIYMADQDVINHAFSKGKFKDSSLHVHRDWYTNYRPEGDETLAKWRAVHWMGVEKPWGKRGHTNAPVRYCDQALPKLDAMWMTQCHKVAADAQALHFVNVTVHCGKGVTRSVPGPVDVSFYYLAVMAVLTVLLVRQTHGACRRACGCGCAGCGACFAVALWAFAVYLTTDWDHAGWVREPLGLASFEWRRA